MIGTTCSIYGFRSPEIKLRDLIYFEFQLKIINIAKKYSNVKNSANYHNRQGGRQPVQGTDSKKIFVYL